MIRSSFAAVAAIAASTLVPATASAQALSPDWNDPQAWEVPGRYVVDFDDDVSLSTVASALSALGVSGFDPGPLVDDTKVVSISLPRGAARILSALRGDGRIEGVEPLTQMIALDFMGPSFVPDDPMYEQQWHMPRIGTEAAWPMSVGRGVTVAVIDTGIACENFNGFTKATDLVQTTCVPGKSFVGKHTSDDHGHGTHVAGTVAQSTNNALGTAGIAFEARLMPVKVLTARGFGTNLGVAAGIRWAADHGAQVINLSLGGPSPSGIIQRAVNHARARGAVVIAAAGNSGDSVGYPGGSEGVIGVSATDADDGLAWFSSRGEGVDIAAPGVNVTQQTICEHGKNQCEIYGTFNGTSMASPHVAGAAALLVGLGVNDVDEVERLLLASAKPLDQPEGENHFGAGLLRADQATASVVQTQLMARLLALLGLAIFAFRWARKRGGAVASFGHGGFWLSGLTFGVGLLFFAPWVLSRHELWVDLLSRPVGEWSLLQGMATHRFLPLAHGFVPLALTAMFYSWRGARPWLAGAAVGTGAYLASIAALGQLSTPFGSLLTIGWCALNGLFCVYLASLLLRKR